MSRTCPRIEDLSAWVDAELSAGERARLDAHFATCAACRARLDELQALRASFRDLPEERLSFDLSQVIRGRIESMGGRAAQPRRRRWQRLVPVGFGAAASLSLGLAGGWLLTAPAARTTPLAAMEVFAPVAPGGLCADLDACFGDGARGGAR